MNYETIEFKLDDHVARITLNRPDRLNSFTAQMHQELRSALADAAEARVVILTGAGRAFCAGQDLNERSVAADDRPVDLWTTVETGWNPLITALTSMPQPVIAQVNGVAAGAGANLAFACDFVLAASEASFIQSFTKIGLVPDTGGTFFLPRTIGMARATALMMLGTKVTAAEAVAMGLILRAVDGGTLMDEATALAKQLATQPTRGLGLIKRALNASATNGLDEQLALEAQLQAEAGSTADYREGVKAFIEKRPPVFVGR